MADETQSSEKEKHAEQNTATQSDGSRMIVLRREFGVWNFNAKRISFLIFLFFSQQLFSQHTISLNGIDNQSFESNSNNVNIHSAVKPALDVDLNGRSATVVDSVVTVGPRTYIPYVTKYEFSYPRATFANYYRRPSDTTSFSAGGNFGFLIRPIYDLNAGYDFSGKRFLYTTAGGAVLDADYKQKIGIEIRAAAGTATLPNYLDSIAKHSGTMPGWGDRAYANGNANYSFQHISGNLIWRPSKIFNLQVGRDKHFWGDGYRSLFLSDVSGAMPYIKQTTTIWKLQYVSLFTWMQDYSHGNQFAKDFRNKFGTFHYISFNASKWLNIGIFESIIWQGNDPNRQRSFDVNYLNPVIFFRPVEYSLGSSDNAMLGGSLKFRLNKNNQLYSQILLDEFFLKEIIAHNGWWANKQGYQFGFKCFNFARVKNLFLQNELNIVRPYTYSHGSSQQNYSNAGMPLAHPLGANFTEFITILSYSKKQFTLTGKIIGARYGLDTAGTDYGQNIFISYMNRSGTDPNHPTDKDYNHNLYDGVATNMFYAELDASYQFNTAFPLRVEFIAGSRREHNALTTKKGTYVQLGLSLPLWKTYRDY